jgi:hypothetical protein
MNDIKIILLALLCALIFSIDNAEAQIQQTSHFIYPNTEVSITPKYPAICDMGAGVKVTCNQDFLYYKWMKDTQVLGEGKKENGNHEILIKEPGDDYTLVVTYVNKSKTNEPIECKAELKFKVKGLEGSEIADYFRSSGFWEIPINRELISCRNCPCDALNSAVSFTGNGDYIKLQSATFERFSEFSHLAGKDYNKIITNNDCLCPSIEDIESDFLNSELGVWGHQYFEDENTREGSLFLKATMPGHKEAPINEHLAEMEDAFYNGMLAAGDNTFEQAGLIFTNLFIVDKMEGGDSQSQNQGPCAQPLPTWDNDYWCFTPAGVAVKLPADAQNVLWATYSMSPPCMPGCFYSFNAGGMAYDARWDKATLNFVGYINRKTKEIKYDKFQTLPSGINKQYQKYLRISNIPKSNSKCMLEDDRGYFYKVLRITNRQDGGAGLPIPVSEYQVADTWVEKKDTINYCPEPLPRSIQYGDPEGKYQFYLVNEYTIYKVPSQNGSPALRFIAAINDEQSNNVLFFEWINNCWVLMELNDPFKVTRPVEEFRLVNELSKKAHVLLDIAGAIPVLGTPADLLNAGIYALEGNYTDAAFSLVGIAFEGAVFLKYAAGAYSGAVVLTKSGKLVAGIKGLIKIAGEYKRIPYAEIGKHLDEVITQLPVGSGNLRQFSDDLIDIFKTNPPFLEAIAYNLGLVRGWAALHSSTDPLVRAMSTNLDQLKIFDDILKKNADNFTFADLRAILHPRYADGTPKVWDDITAVLPAAKRMVDANIPGAKMGHKKFPVAAEGNAGGALVPAKIYQKNASGDANISILVKDVSFDNVNQAGELIDRKFGYANSIFTNSVFDKVNKEFVEVDLFVHNENRINSLLDQARRQIDAEDGKQIVWEVPFSLAKDGIEAVFRGDFPDLLRDFRNIDFTKIRIDIVPL